MIKACIFDVDGTLVDSVDAHATTWVQALAAFGHPLAFDDVRFQIGKGGDQLMPVFLSRDEIAQQGEAIEKVRSRLLKDDHLAAIRAFPEVRGLFERLRSDGVQRVLASSAKSDELQIYKQKADIVDLVDTETSAEDAKRSKPYGDIFEAALRKLPGIARSEIIVFGDTPYDAEAAARVGLRTIGMRSAGFSDEVLLEAGSIELFDDPADLLSNYDRIFGSGSRAAPSD